MWGVDGGWEGDVDGWDGGEVGHEGVLVCGLDGGRVGDEESGEADVEEE